MMRSNPGRGGRVLAAVLTAALIAGCALNRPAIVKQTFLLEPAPPATVAKAQPGTLRVGTVTVAGAYRGRSFVVREDDLRFATDYYHEFVTPPGAMIGELTARALARAAVFTHVASPGSPADTDYVLDAFVGSLYSDRRSGGAIAAELSITFYLSQSNTGSNVPFWSHTYNQRVSLRGDTAESYVEALNTAFGNILAELARDLATAPLPAAH
jgi:cholesterol transport system auxiliary component